MYCSIQQALGIWDDLRDAMEKKHGFGGDTAEIYTYRLMPNIPTMGITKWDEEDVFKANRSLVEIIDMFTEKHRVNFLINELKPHSWLKKYGYTSDHRVHVRCTTLLLKKQ